MTKVMAAIIMMIEQLFSFDAGMGQVRCPYAVAMMLIKKYPDRLGHVKLLIGSEGMLPSGAKLKRVDNLHNHGRGFALCCYAHDNSDGTIMLDELYYDAYTRQRKLKKIEPKPPEPTIVCALTGKEFFMKGIHYFSMEDNKRVNAYVSTYTSIGGPKAVMLSIDDECGGHYTPWNTWYAAKDMDGAIRDAKCWAESEDVPCFIQ